VLEDLVADDQVEAAFQACTPDRDVADLGVVVPAVGRLAQLVGGDVEPDVARVGRPFRRRQERLGAGADVKDALAGAKLRLHRPLERGAGPRLVVAGGQVAAPGIAHDVRDAQATRGRCGDGHLSGVPQRGR
jgi:hypothetical protein